MLKVFNVYHYHLNKNIAYTLYLLSAGFFPDLCRNTLHVLSLVSAFSSQRPVCLIKNWEPFRGFELPAFCPKASDREGNQAWMSPYSKPIFPTLSSCLSTQHRQLKTIAQRSLKQCFPIWPYMPSLNSSNKACPTDAFAHFFFNN